MVGLWRVAPALVTAGFLACLVVIIVVADRGALPEWVGAYRRLPGGDVLVHGVLIGAAAGMVNWAAAGQMVRLGRWRMPTGSVWIGLLAVGEEIAQIWIPARTFSWGDLAGNAVGILVLGTAGWWLGRSRAAGRLP